MASRVTVAHPDHRKMKACRIGGHAVTVRRSLVKVVYKKEPVLNASVSLDAPERQFVDFCALRTLFDLCWDCTLWVALTADRERRARLGVNDGDHLPSKIAKKLVIGLIPVGHESAI